MFEKKFKASTIKSMKGSIETNIEDLQIDAKNTKGFRVVKQLIAQQSTGMTSSFSSESQHKVLD